MRTAEQWLQIISNTDKDHPCDCICKRCKNGNETFLIEEDFEQVIQDAYNQAIEDAINKIKDAMLTGSPYGNKLVVVDTVGSLRKPTTTTKQPKK